MAERLAYPIEEAAEQLGISRSYVYAEIAAGRLESVSIGRRRLVTRTALEAYLAARSANDDGRRSA